MLFCIVLLGVRFVLCQAAYQQKDNADQPYFSYPFVHTYNESAIVCVGA
jgi:hypothetical protein